MTSLLPARLPYGGASAGPVQDHVIVDLKRIGPSKGGDGVLHPLSFVSYAGSLGVWEGELPVVGTPIKLMLLPGGAGILVMNDPKAGGARTSITF